jgi:hypothetical protein
VLRRAPQIVYFCQKANVPSVSLPVTKQITPFIDVPRPGQRMSFEPFTITFKLQEDFANYLELFNRMVGLGSPDNFDQYKALGGNVKRPPQSGVDTFFSDGTLTILDSAKNVNVQVIFQDMFPVYLQEIPFDMAVERPTNIDVSAGFAYQRFTVNVLDTQ